VGGPCACGRTFRLGRGRRAPPLPESLAAFPGQTAWLRRSLSPGPVGLRQKWRGGSHGGANPSFFHRAAGLALGLRGEYRRVTGHGAEEKKVTRMMWWTTPAPGIECAK